MALIIIMTFVLYTVVIGWVWNNLGDINRVKKLIIIFIEILTIYLITLIAFNISKSGIDYDNKEIENAVRNTIVILFTGFNSLIALPFFDKQVLKLKVEEKNAKGRNIIKRLAIMLLIFMMCIIFECSYMKDTQKGILEVHQARTQQQIK